MANYITYSTLANGKTAVNMATIGLAALQLPYGATAHSVCKIPDSDEDVLSCTLPMNSQGARELAKASVLQWDEWLNAKRSAWESALKLLEQIKQHHSQIWNPKAVVCYGDFRQIPPVVKGGTRDSIANNSVRTSPSWTLFTTCALQVNHRQHRDLNYAAWLATIGDGTAPSPHRLSDEPGHVLLDRCDCLRSEEACVDFCFDSLNDPFSMRLAQNTLPHQCGG